MSGQPTPTGNLLGQPARLLAVVVTGALFLAGALLLADWLRDRDAAFGIATPRAEPPRVLDQALDPRVEAFLGGGVAWAPPRLDHFGPSPAALVVGHDLRAPKEVFARMLGGGWDDEARRAALRAGPSAAVALRTQATVGVMPTGAFLVRMPPDLAAAAEGRLRTEPGAVTLAFPAARGWDYVTWAFPEGLDLDGLPAAFRAPPQVLTPLDGAADHLLEPVFAFGGDGVGPRTILCRAQGGTGDVVREVAARLRSRGWVRHYASDAQDMRAVRVLRHGQQEIWLTAASTGKTGGMVSVMLSSL